MRHYILYANGYTTECNTMMKYYSSLLMLCSGYWLYWGSREPTRTDFHNKTASWRGVTACLPPWSSWGGWSQAKCSVISKYSLGRWMTKEIAVLSDWGQSELTNQAGKMSRSKQMNFHLAIPHCLAAAFIWIKDFCWKPRSFSCLPARLPGSRHSLSSMIYKSKKDPKISRSSGGIIGAPRLINPRKTDENKWVMVQSFHVGLTPCWLAHMNSESKSPVRISK